MARRLPPSFTALGRRSLPDEIEVEGRTYRKQRVFKNDFFAVTAMYADASMDAETPTDTGRPLQADKAMRGSDNRRVLVKVGRQASFLLVPLRWLGRMLAAREAAALTRLDDVAGVPRMIARWGSTGIVREFVEGHALAKGEHVPDDFHTRLRQLIDTIHERGMAYVDLEKCENVLVGDDGRPHLFDFQIAWYVSRRWGGELGPMRMLRRWLQNGDRYHLVKLQRRTRPDQLSPEQLAASYRRPWYIRVHKLVTRPFTLIRRAILGLFDRGPKQGERGRIIE